MEKGPKVIKAVSKKGFKTMLGVFLCVLNVVLFIDVGYFAKTLNFIPFYLFGFMIYFFYGFVFVFGAYLVFSNNDQRVKTKWFYVLPIVASLICLGVILTTALQPVPCDFSNMMPTLNSFFASYYEPFNLPLILSGNNTGIGGGLCGYLIVAIFYSMHFNAFAIYLLTAFLWFISFIPLLLHFILILFKKNKEKSNKEREEIASRFSNYTSEDLQKEIELSQEEENLRRKLREDKIIEREKIREDKIIEKEKNREVKINEKEKLREEKIKEQEIKRVQINEKKIENELKKSNSVSNDDLYNASRQIKEEEVVKETKDNMKINDLSKQVIKDAKKLQGDDHIIRKEETTSADYVGRPQPIIFNNGDYVQHKGLSKAHFVRPGSKAVKTSDIQPVETSIITAPTHNETSKITSTIESQTSSSVINESVKPVVDEIKAEKVPLAKPEQLKLDFSAPKEVEIDENIIACKPEFMEPEVANKKEEEKPEPAPAKPAETYRPFVPIDYDSLLNDYEVGEALELNELTAKQRMHKINEVFQSFKVKAYCTDYTVGPAVTRYHIECGEGVSVNAVNRVIGDLSVHLGGVDARFEPLVIGKSYSGLEIPNAKITTVGFKECLNNLPPQDKKPFAVAFGKGIDGEVVNAQLIDFPHMLISGTTGSGKSVFAHSIIMTLIMRNSPDDLRMVLIDPKQVELSKYTDMPHLLCPIITDPAEALEVMNQLVKEMDEVRNPTFKDCHVVDFAEYSEYCDDHPEAKRFPRIVVFIDEYADLVDCVKDIARPILRLGQKARSCGIHLIISTQRPSTNIVNGVIKSNLPTHVALMTANSVDSITIIGEGGAEKLLGKGDMLVQCPLISRVGSVRLQSAYVQGKEINKVVDFLKKTYETRYDKNFLNLSEPETIDPNLNPFMNDEKEFHDDKYEYIKSVVMASEYASISKIQREFSVGFSRAGKIFIQLQKEGIVDMASTSKGSKVLVHNDYYNIQAPDISSSDGTKVEMCNADDIINTGE